jgi:hypothetical protein
MAGAKSAFSVIEKDLGWKEIKKSFQALARAGDTYVKAGFVGEKAQEQHVNSTLTIAELGTVHEFGAGRVPERSYIRSTYDKFREAYWATLRTGMSQVYAGKAKVESILDLIGSNMAGDQRKAIRDGIPPPLADSTVKAKMAKGRKDAATPLLDTRQMVNNLTHQVVVGGKVVLEGNPPPR